MIAFAQILEPARSLHLEVNPPPLYCRGRKVSAQLVGAVGQAGFKSGEDVGIATVYLVRYDGVGRRRNCLRLTVGSPKVKERFVELLDFGVVQFRVECRFQAGAACDDRVDTRAAKIFRIAGKRESNYSAKAGEDFANAQDPAGHDFRQAHLRTLHHVDDLARVADDFLLELVP